MRRRWIASARVRWVAPTTGNGLNSTAAMLVGLCRIGEPGDDGVPAGCGDRHDVEWVPAATAWLPNLQAALGS